MTVRFVSLAVVFLLVSLPACESVGIEHAENELDGSRWQLRAFGTPDGSRIEPNIPAEDQGNNYYTLRFGGRDIEPCDTFLGNDTAHEGWRIRVRGYPNTACFTYERTERHALTTSFQGATKLGRPSISKEEKLFDALKDVHSYAIEDGQLSVYYGDENALLFEEQIMP